VTSPAVPQTLDDADIPEGWTRVDEVPLLLPTPRFLSSTERVTVRYFTRESDDDIVCLTRFGLDTEGPPGHAHGGSIASVLDEVMGFACLFRAIPVLAAHIEVDFRAPLPIPNVLMGLGRITGVDGRKISTAGVLKGLDGTVYSESTGLFIKMSAETMVNMG